MANNLENSINQANGKFVNFDQHREKYTTHYNALRDKVYSEWKGSGVLGKLVTGYTLGGGYGDNLKVSMPDEFDLVIHLTFPENDKIIARADPRKPGNVILDMSKVMEIIRNQEHNKAVFELLQKIVNGKKQLLEDKLQSWLQGIMTQTFNKMDKQIEVGGEISPLSYKKCGPAHTIFVKGRYEYSVDFVPAIKLSAAQVVLAPEQMKYFAGTPYWDAIPKPMKPAQNENPSFRASFYDAERRLLHGKNNLKNAIRLLKQHRNVKNKANLKSYYIKTLFLWEVTRQDASYWQKSLTEILIDMLSKLGETLKLTSKKGKLPFFWDPKLDMFAELTDPQRADMFNCVTKAEYTFRRGDGNLTGDIENNVQSSFSNKEKDKGAENKSPNGNGQKTSPKPNQDCNPAKPNEQKGAATSSPKPKEPKQTVEAKVQSTPNKAIPKPNALEKKPVEIQTGSKPKTKVEPTPVKPNPKPAKVVTAPVQAGQAKQNPPVVAENTNPNGIKEKEKSAEAQNGTKPKAKMEPTPVKPNPKPAKVVTAPVQAGQAKQNPPVVAENTNPNGIKEKEKSAEAQNGTKPKAKMEPTPVKPNPKPAKVVTAPLQAGHAKQNPPVVAENTNPNGIQEKEKSAEAQNGTKPKAKMEPTPVKPNPKPKAETPPVQPNQSNQNPPVGVKNSIPNE
nr:uncharacterized protein LOC108018091 isoform X3 [Drosophila suzukii]